MGTNVFEERSRRTEMSPALGSAEPLCRYTGSAARAAPGARSHPWGCNWGALLSSLLCWQTALWPGSALSWQISGGKL